MKPRPTAQRVLSITRSKAKMYEYNIPLEDHIAVPGNPSQLFDLTIGMIGEITALIHRGQSESVNSEELRQNIQFSSYFFDAFINSRINQSANKYMQLLAAASYYLCELPGSSQVLAKQLDITHLDLQGGELEKCIAWIIKSDTSQILNISNPLYGESWRNICTALSAYFASGVDPQIETSLKKLVDTAYDVGTPRELLFADVIYALVKKKIENSIWASLPKYSDIPVATWHPILGRINFKEIWPSQKLLGENGVFKGKSAIIQMPTSAGKTKATELIIRSSFLSGRSSLAVIVAPFRALCHEIFSTLQKSFKDDDIKVDQISDAIQVDFELQRLLGHKQVIILTPEKLNYILRHDASFSAHIKTVIYDEGHLFDDETRGTTYELLLASLKQGIPPDAQTILISAVIKNADDINSWLLPEESQVVSGSKLPPTYRTLAFVSWQDVRGRLEFVNPSAPERNEFFVPRVIEQQNLALQGKERTPRSFPNKDDPNEIALYLGLKLCANGAVAIFSGRKDTAASFCEIIVEKYNRGLPIPAPRASSSEDEVNKLHYLYRMNYGENAPATKAADLGIYAHHGNTPQGIRLAVEYSLQNELTKFVICTSTLAQGVNLPLRYLIITGTRQGQDRIKTRDFHNLLGRAGRAGMYTEGSIIFANPDIYDKKHVYREKWRWQEAVGLLDPDNSEACISCILTFFEPWASDDSKMLHPMDTTHFLDAYLNATANLNNLPQQIVDIYPTARFSIDGLKYQINTKKKILGAIESYLMSHSLSDTWEDARSQVIHLAKNTLAYSQGGEDEQEKIENVFVALAEKIYSSESLPSKRKAYSKVFLGMQSCKSLDHWVTENSATLFSSNTDNNLIDVLWPLFIQYADNPNFNKCSSTEALKEILLGWVAGKEFYRIYEGITSEVRFGIRTAKIEHVIDICENSFGFGAALLMNAVIELLTLNYPDTATVTVQKLKNLQKKIKYGLPNLNAINLSELGVVDRTLAISIAQALTSEHLLRSGLIAEMREKHTRISEIVNVYPSYYKIKVGSLLG